MAGSDLKEIRDAFEYDRNEWDDIRIQRKADIRALSPVGTWSDRDRAEREQAGRPCLHLDELSQYVNQLNNDVRETKRAIEVKPRPGPSKNPASEAQARFIADLIRQIEYRSNAQRAYEQMAEDCFQGSYGFVRITTRYMHDRLDQKQELTARCFDQELCIEAVPNPELITPGFAIQPDLSDMKRCHVETSYSHKEFKRKFPSAEVGFSHASFQEAGPLWLQSDRVWVREFWEIRERPRKVVLLPDPMGGEPLAVWKDEIPKKEWTTLKDQVLREREAPNPYVCMSVTNGLEILERHEDWPGKYIPIVGCLGKVLWVANEDGPAKRQILSLIRLARDPQQLYNYYRTTEAEYAGMSPKFPYFAYEGSLESDELEKLVNSVRLPVGVVQIKPQIEGMPANTPTPFPQRTQAVDGQAIQALSMGSEDARRAIQSATGTGFLPTAAQRQNEKSGVALKQIVSSAQKGAFHFIDHYEDAIRQVGVVLVDAIPYFYDTARDVAVRKPNEQVLQVRINDPNAEPNEEYGENVDTSYGEYDVALDTGPSYDDERDKASEFADSLVQNKPETFMWFADLIFKLKNLGPIGDEMVKRAQAMLPPAIQQTLNGQQGDPQQLAAQLQQAQAQMQQMGQMLQELQDELKADKIKAETQLMITQMKNQVALALQQMKGDLELEKLDRTHQHEDVDREDTQKHEKGLEAAKAAHEGEQAEKQMEQAERQADRQESQSRYESSTAHLRGSPGGGKTQKGR